MDTCEFHDEMVKARKDSEMAIEGKVSKGTIKWIGGLFALPAVIAVMATYAFVVNADYRFGSSQQAQINASNIKLLDERTVNIKSEIVRLQADITTDLGTIKLEIRDLARDVRRFREDDRTGEKTRK